MLEEIIPLFGIKTNFFLNLAFFTTIIVLYSIFVFYFYRFLAKKNILELNLGQYNQYENPTLIKIFAGILYIFEYIIILPILTFFWFSTLATLTLVLAKSLEVTTVLLIVAALVTAVRITSYISQDLAKDLAKMVPFTLLAIAITTKDFFDIPGFAQRMNEIPALFSSIPYYLLFIIAVEFLMRIGEFLHSALGELESDDSEDPQ